MPAVRNAVSAPRDWTPIADPPQRYSSGIPGFDRLMGGGFPRGSLSLFSLDDTLGPVDLDALVLPTLLNFLYQSRGVIAVLPSRDSPQAFRSRVTRYATRRRFDSRVRIVTYVSEGDEEPYIVQLKSRGRSPKTETRRDVAKMVAAERAAKGGRGRAILELNAFEVAEMLFGTAVATRMFFHGIKRARAVGNLMIGLMRPGLGAAASIRSMADTEFEVRRDPAGIVLRGIRPAFPDQLLTADRTLGLRHVSLAPMP